MTEDWAEAQARKWLKGILGRSLGEQTAEAGHEANVSSLAALLREMEQAGHKRHGWWNPKRPAHGPCCTCQRCGQFYDDCRCDLDEAVAELEQAKPKLLAEVRRVVEDVRAVAPDFDSVRLVLDSILARLEKL